MFGELLSFGGQLLGGLLGRSSASSQAAEQAKMQEAFAKNSVRWRVADAKRAGIHPLAALGAQTHSYSPVAFNDPLPNALANAGQDIGRAIDATRTRPERADAYVKTVQDLNITRLGLENELLASQIGRIRSAGHPPPMPTGSQGNVFATTDAPGTSPAPVAPLTEPTPSKVPVTYPSTPEVQPGTPPELQYYRTGPNTWQAQPSEQMKQAIEDDFWGQTEYAVKNRILPRIGMNRRPPFQAPPGSEWVFNAISGDYQLMNKNRGGNWLGPDPYTPYTGHR